ncbi:Serine protease inhibitor- potato inhibitor I-type family protein [Striga hermonthica]|uniref:Serine protease inhibitor- potato inhibitor I-type family protein n=1 Tax=Striga hermonthica TaxID=68872 RepID=A0A9N7NM25_STRHE|nr:Serine protease inhibitor- potato inhibitor I-type family protein [Striga hermonthica]
MSSHKRPYPPCAAHCNYRGYKREWPELVGQPAQKCKAQIEKENPFVNVVPIYRDDPFTDPYGPLFCCNRVYLFLEKTGICYFIPTVGSRHEDIGMAELYLVFMVKEMGVALPLDDEDDRFVATAEQENWVMELMDSEANPSSFLLLMKDV